MGAFADFFARLRREKPLAVVLAIVLPLLIGVALLADVLAPFALGLRARSARHH